MTKYWKGILGSSKEGQCGTMSDSGFVPDADETTKAEYDLYIASLPVVTPQKDFKDLFSKAATVNDKIQLIAEKVGML